MSMRLSSRANFILSFSAVIDSLIALRIFSGFACQFEWRAAPRKPRAIQTGMPIAEKIRSAISESMTALKDKIKLALDESRMLILGAQILWASICEPHLSRHSIDCQGRRNC